VITPYIDFNLYLPSILNSAVLGLLSLETRIHLWGNR